MGKIYILEDDKNISEIEQFALKNAGYEVSAFATASDFENALTKEHPDLIIMDIMLPDRDGLSVLKDVRAEQSTAKLPVIMVTAKTSEMDKVKGLDQGADDYMTKPFDVKEVIARVQIQLRHLQHGAGEESTHLKCRGMDLDKETHRVMIDGQELGHLTRQEFAILELLLEHPGQVFSKEAVFTYAWQEEYMGETKTLDVHISNIRKKIKKITEQEYIQTVWGIGYCMVAHL